MAQRGAMNAGQDAAVAPLHFAVCCCENVRAAPAPALPAARARSRSPRRGTQFSRPARYMVTGPSDSIQPDTTAFASSASEARSVATQKSFADRVMIGNTSRRTQVRRRMVCHSSNGGKRTSVSSASCSSSASRASGHDFGRNLIDDRRIENAFPAGHVGSERLPQLNGARAALFERRIVQEGVGIGVQDLVRKLRSLRGIDGDGADAPLFDAPGGFVAARRDPSLRSRQLSMVSLTSG